MKFREMTSAEFAKTRLVEVDEPISIRHYTKTVGTYYPASYEIPTAFINMGDGVTPDQVEALRLELGVDKEAVEKIKALEEEVKHLKRRLAGTEDPFDFFESRT